MKGLRIEARQKLNQIRPGHSWTSKQNIWGFACRYQCFDGIFEIEGAQIMFKDFQIDLKQYGLQLDDYQNKQFERYYEILIEGNEKTNLTGIVEKIDVYTKHFLDSIVICKYLNKNSSLIDIGTGAGFPAVPIKNSATRH